MRTVAVGLLFVSSASSVSAAAAAANSAVKNNDDAVDHHHHDEHFHHHSHACVHDTPQIRRALHSLPLTHTSPTNTKHNTAEGNSQTSLASSASSLNDDDQDDFKVVEIGRRGPFNPLHDDYEKNEGDNDDGGGGGNGNGVLKRRRHSVAAAAGGTEERHLVAAVYGPKELLTTAIVRQNYGDSSSIENMGDNASKDNSNNMIIRREEAPLILTHSNRVPHTRPASVFFIIRH